eukprot:13804565-Alexandrium_andersonii.AAC.1
MLEDAHRKEPECVHACVDLRIQASEERLRSLLEASDLDLAWEVWARAVEEGFLDACKLTGGDRDQYRGRGKVVLETKHKHVHTSFAEAAGTNGCAECDASFKHLKATRRLKAIVGALGKRPQCELADWPKRVRDMWDAVCADVESHHLDR